MHRARVYVEAITFYQDLIKLELVMPRRTTILAWLYASGAATKGPRLTFAMQSGQSRIFPTHTVILGPCFDGADKSANPRIHCNTLSS
jgi:hypothetical protein